jgi:cation transporter-like permease
MSFSGYTELTLNYPNNTELTLNYPNNHSERLATSLHSKTNLKYMIHPSFIQQFISSELLKVTVVITITKRNKEGIE